MKYFWYATREQVKRSLEISHTARVDSLIDQKLEATAPSIEGLLKRRFYPEIKTYKKDWPNYSSAPTWQLSFDDEFISLISLSSGGTSIPTGNVFLRRWDDRPDPPFSYIEINKSTTSAFAGGSTDQRAVEAQLLLGYNDTDTSIASALLGGGINSSVTTLVLNPSAGVFDVGVGALLLIGTERLILTNRSMSDSGQNLQTNMNSNKSDVIVDVTDGTVFAVNETILLGSERMRIVDIAGNNLIVDRAFDGSVLSAHTAPEDIYALRTFTAKRGAMGTTATSHSSSDPCYTHDYPGPVQELHIAEAVVALEQNSGGYARVVGSGPNARESAGKGLEDARNKALAWNGKVSRLGAI